MILSHYFEEKKRAVEDFLQSIQTPVRGTPVQGGLSHLVEAMKYSLLAGGKRLRPVLVVAAYEACAGDPRRLSDGVVPFAAALEMIHTYSLIHDDLPAMDNDDLRRGRPTSHKVYGEAVAILAGDALLTEAFSVMAKVRLPGRSETILEVISDIADASGVQGMAGGQLLDLKAEGRQISAEELEALHRHKTGRLIEVSVTTGAKLAGAKGDLLSRMTEYGRSVGLAFQIADDILDVEGGVALLGKNTGGDALKGKSTYPGLLGMEPSRQKATHLRNKAVQALTNLGPAAEPLRLIAEYIVSRSS